LVGLGFERVRQSGSHIMLKHDTTGEVISVPAHRPLKTGTLNKLLRDIAELTGLSRDAIIDALG
jgi:predicted RNA binding protein YcfA (HicA-like mRNA interferase family)